MTSGDLSLSETFSVFFFEIIFNQLPTFFLFPLRVSETELNRLVFKPRPRSEAFGAEHRTGPARFKASLSYDIWSSVKKNELSLNLSGSRLGCTGTDGVVGN